MIREDDAGSHHICLENISSSLGPGTFCELTGQPDWCRKQGSCTEGQCPRENWCVCQWAFAKVIEEVGCEALSVKCDAIPQRVLQDYQRTGKDEAWKCLQEKCNL